MIKFLNFIIAVSFCVAMPALLHGKAFNRLGRVIDQPAAINTSVFTLMAASVEKPQPELSVDARPLIIAALPN